MPRTTGDDNKRMNLRNCPEQKATLMPASFLRNTDLKDCMSQVALRYAEAAEHVALSERDSLRVLEMLENPSTANAKLRAAAKAMPLPL